MIQTINNGTVSSVLMFRCQRFILTQHRVIDGFLNRIYISCGAISRIQHHRQRDNRQRFENRSAVQPLAADNFISYLLSVGIYGKFDFLSFCHVCLVIHKRANFTRRSQYFITALPKTPKLLCRIYSVLDKLST